MKRKLKINKSAFKNIEAYRSDWENTGLVSVKDFLDETSAYFLHNFLTRKISERWWGRKFAINEEDNRVNRVINMGVVQKDADVKSLADDMLLKCQEAFSRHVYCFSFDYFNQAGHDDACACLMCDYRLLISSEEFKEFVQAITGIWTKLDVTKLKASRYQSGQFLAPHNDRHHGAVGGMHHLTRNWLPAYGGNLQILNTDMTEVKKLIVPEFNALTFISLDKSCLHHGVTHVAPFVRRSRYGISYWLDEEDESS